MINMRTESEIGEKLKELRDEHKRMRRERSSLERIAVMIWINALEWVLDEEGVNNVGKCPG